MTLLGLLVGCAEPFWDVETTLDVAVDGPTEVDVIAWMGHARARVSSTAIVRVTSTPDAGADPDEGVIVFGLGAPENDWEEVAVAGVDTVYNSTRIDGVAESYVTTRQQCHPSTGECWSGYCFDDTDCPVRFVVHINPRDQQFSTQLRFQWRQLMSEFPMECGNCDMELSATVR